MEIIINGGDYSAVAVGRVLGVMGEVNSRRITVRQPETDGATDYRLRFEYPDGAAYDLPVNEGFATVPGSLLRMAGEVKCQWIASAAEGESYTLVAKSPIFELFIEPSVSEDIAPIPTYEATVEALDKMWLYAEAASAAKSHAETAERAAASAAESAETAEGAAAEVLSVVGDINAALAALCDGGE